MRNPENLSKLELNLKYERILSLYLFGFGLIIFGICCVAFIQWWYSEPSLGVLIIFVTPVYMILIVIAEIRVFILKRSLRLSNTD